MVFIFIITLTSLYESVESKLNHKTHQNIINTSSLFSFSNKNNSENQESIALNSVYYVYVKNPEKIKIYNEHYKLCHQNPKECNIFI